MKNIPMLLFVFIAFICTSVFATNEKKLIDYMGDKKFKNLNVFIAKKGMPNANVLRLMGIDGGVGSVAILEIKIGGKVHRYLMLRIKDVKNKKMSYLLLLPINYNVSTNSGYSLFTGYDRFNESNRALVLGRFEEGYETTNERTYGFPRELNALTGNIPDNSLRSLLTGEQVEIDLGNEFNLSGNENLHQFVLDGGDGWPSEAANLGDSEGTLEVELEDEEVESEDEQVESEDEQVERIDEINFGELRYRGPEAPPSSHDINIDLLHNEDGEDGGCWSSFCNFVSGITGGCMGGK